MKYVYIGLGVAPYCGTVGEEENFNSESVKLTTEVDNKQWYATYHGLVEYDEFVKTISEALEDKELYWQDDWGEVHSSPSKFDHINYNEEFFDELMFFTKDGQWSKVKTDYGETWVVVSRTPTTVIRQSLEAFIRDKFR